MRRRSYAVWWNEADSTRHAGKLEIGPLHVLLAGNRSGRLAVPLDELVSVEYRRGELRLTRRRGQPIQIGSLDAPGALLELASCLGRLPKPDPGFAATRGGIPPMCLSSGGAIL
jgi:hypothetical protein